MIGAGFCIVADDKILLLYRSMGSASGTWAFPGGKAEDGEDAFATAMRETEEEVGVSPIGTLMGEHTASNDFVTLLLKIDATFTPSLSKEHSAWGWFTEEELPTPLHWAVEDFIVEMNPYGSDRAHDSDTVWSSSQLWKYVFDNTDGRKRTIAETAMIKYAGRKYMEFLSEFDMDTVKFLNINEGVKRAVKIVFESMAPKIKDIGEEFSELHKHVGSVPYPALKNLVDRLNDWIRLLEAYRNAAESAVKQVEEMGEQVSQPRDLSKRMM